MHLQNLSRLGFIRKISVFQVHFRSFLFSIQGLKTFVLGDRFPHSEKKLEYKQKSYIFCLFLPNYYLAIASGARNLVASER